ncbi:hypothetical protein [Mesorhizobium silamurunense]|nr:hypothetical protein [Mesorhizobium silamurunense]
MTVDMLIQTYGHHHPDFQADAADAIVSKARSRNLPVHDRAKSLLTIK